MNYKNIIDGILLKIEQEKTSRHEAMTKAINYEYYSGQLYMIYDLAEKDLDFQDFRTIYEYRKEDRSELDYYFNQSIINPIYKALRPQKKA